ncbi:MAG: type II toxin-antitoxin system ParD family antitoxin [Xenococcaceae cyanobacterium]
MHIRFAEVDGNFIKQEIENGYYTNETELVRDAVRRLREEKQRAQCFHAAVMKGVEDIEAGRTTPFTRELMDKLVQEGIARAEAGESDHSTDTIPHND